MGEIGSLAILKALRSKKVRCFDVSCDALALRHVIARTH